MKKKYKGTLKQQKKLALAEISSIFNKAKEVFDKKPDLANNMQRKPGEWP